MYFTIFGILNYCYTAAKQTVSSFIIKSKTNRCVTNCSIPISGTINQSTRTDREPKKICIKFPSTDYMI